MSKKQEVSNEEEQEQTLGEFLEQITPLVESVAPALIEYQKNQAPLVKRNQLINAIIMFTILLGIIFLAYNQIIDGSAATGLIGAIIGYVFGGLYQQRNR